MAMREYAGGWRRPVLKKIAGALAALAAIASRRDARMRLEDALQMALVRKPSSCASCANAVPACKRLRAVDVRVQLVGMRRHAGGGAKARIN